MKINDIQVWVNGEMKTANNLLVRSIADDLKSTATFYWEISFVTEEGAQSPVASGNQHISGTDYENWGSTGDINKEAYAYVAGKLNITLA